MNKRSIRIAGWALGLSLALGGVGAAVGASQKVSIQTFATAVSGTGTSTLTFSAKPSNGGSVTAGTGGATYTFATDSEYIALDSSTIVHTGSKSKTCGYQSYTSADFSSVKITSVVVNAHMASGSGVSATVTVNGNSLGATAELQTQALTASAANYTFTNPSEYTGGNLVVRLSRSSAIQKAIYCTGITVNYEAISNVEATGITMSPNSLTVYQGETGSFTPTLTGWSGSHESTIEWTSSHPSIIAAPSDSEDGEEVSFTAGSVAVSTDVTLTGTVKVTNGATQTIVVTVKPPRALEGVSITGDMTNKAYMDGDSWDFSGLTVTLDYSEGEDPVYTLDEMLADTENFDCAFSHDSPEVGDTSLTISDIVYLPFDGDVDNRTITGITVSATYNKVTDASSLTVGDSYVVGVGGLKKLMGAKYASGKYRVVVDASDAQMNDAKTKVSQSLPDGAVVVTLLKGSADGKYYIYDITNNKYLNPSSSSNECDDATSLADANEMSFAYSSGDLSIGISSRIFAYNKNSPRFTSYAQSYGDTYYRPVLFKIAGSTVKTAVTAFANTYLKMNDPDYEGNKTTPNCTSNYNAMVLAYSDLSDAVKNVLEYSDDFSAARARMSEWAKANGQTFTYGAATPFAAAVINPSVNINTDYSNFPLIITIVAIGAMAAGGLFLVQRKRTGEE